THGGPAPSVAEHAAMRAFLSALAADGRLDAVLAQFPPSFRFGERTLAYARRLARHFEGFHLAVEFRDASWDRDDVRAALHDDGIASVVADLPRGPQAIPLRAVLPGPLAYVRLHGRSAAWYEPGVGRDRRYD